MKWIGQHIYDFISRFRNDVYLEAPATTDSDPDKFLAIDDNNKIVYRTGEEILSDIGAGSGDITGVTITTDSGGGSAASDTAGSADFSILGSNGVGVTNSGATITAVAVPSEIDHDALSNFVAAEHVDWASSGAGTIHTDNYVENVVQTTVTGSSGSCTGNAATATSAGTVTTGSQPAITSVGTLTGLTTSGSIELGHASDTSIKRIDSGIVTIEERGINTHSNTIKILPSAFKISDDVGRPAFIEDGTSQTLGIRTAGSTDSLYAWQEIPYGMKVTHAHVHASSSVVNGATISSYNYQTGSTNNVASTTFTFNSNTSITNIPSSPTQFVVIECSPANPGFMIFGASLTIALI